MITKFLEKLTPLNLQKEFAGVRLPKLDIETRHYDRLKIPSSVSNTEFLKSLAQSGFSTLVKRGKVDKSRLKEYSERANREIQVFEKLNFVDYVLIVWDLINFCRENNILTGPGRGSVCGSLVFYLIGVTLIDPLKYDLYFERFVSEARAGKTKEIDGATYLDGSLMCDVDLDIDYAKRDRVIEYLSIKYPNRTAKIINLNTLTGKNLIKECGKLVAEKTDFDMKEISNMIPQVFGQVADIEEVYNGVKDEAGNWKTRPNKEFVQWCDENREAYEIALNLRDLVRHKSIHASGIIISHNELIESCPLELSGSKELVSGFDMKEITKFCLKIDVLGLKTLTIIDEVCRSVGIKMEDIDFEDPSIYAYFQDFKNGYGIFQIEGGTADRVIKSVKPENIEELSAVMALARPGAMDFVPQFTDNKKRGYSDSVHPIFDEIFSKTYGLPLYQEQLMKMSNAIGFTLDESEIIRRIVGKKDRDAVKAWEEKIHTKIKENSLPTPLGGFVWDVLNKSKDYSFNKSHSIAYSAVAAITVYLKVNYPKEFFAACLKIAMGEQDRNEKVARISNELKSLGINLLPPNINLSKESFSIEKDGIRFGLGGIHSVGQKVLEKLKNFNGNYNNKFELFEAANHVGVNIGALCALIQAGAVIDTSGSRSKFVLEAQLWNLLTVKEKAYCIQHGAIFNYDLVGMIKKMLTWEDESGKLICKVTKRGSRFETIKKKYDPYKKIYEQNSQYEDFANWWYERHLLGFSYSKSLKEIFLPACQNLSSIEEFSAQPSRSKGIIVGIVEDVVESVNKNKKKYSKFTIEDGSGVLTALVFDEKGGLPGIRTSLKENGRLPKKGQVAAFRGSKFEDIMMIDDIAIQDEKIYIKLADFKREEKEDLNKQQKEAE